MATSVTNEGKPLVDDYFGQSREPWVDANSEAFLRFHPATKRLRVAHSGYCSNTCDFGPPLLSSCSINNTSLTMYDMYHLLYPEYFRRVMQLPRGTRFLPPWKLGMRTSWSFSAARERASADRELLQGTRASAHKKRVSHGWAPARNEGLLLGEWCGRSNDTRYTIEERVPPVGSAYDVLTTTATMPLVAANKPSSPSQSGRQDMSTRPQWPVVPSRYASGRSSTHTSRARKKSCVASLSLHVLRELEKQYHGQPGTQSTERDDTFQSAKVTTNCDRDAETGGPNVLPHYNPFGDNSGSAFLLRVKSEVAARQTSAACGRPRRLDAAERAELQFARGALLSDTTEDSQGSSLALSNSDSQHDGRMSVRSDGATVAGRINPERAYEALKAKLRREQHSAAEIEFEMACHLDPRDARREHRRRRHLRNAAILQRCRRQRDSYAPHLWLGTDPKTRIPKLQRERQPRPSETFRQVGRCAVNSDKVQTGAGFEGHGSYTSQPHPIGEALISTLRRAKKKIYSHDEKVLARKRQKMITRAFTELQKQRDRGVLSQDAFEKKKTELFNHLFEWNNGRVFLKRACNPEPFKTLRQKKTTNPYDIPAFKRLRTFESDSQTVDGSKSKTEAIERDDDNLGSSALEECGGGGKDQLTRLVSNTEDDVEEDIEYAACNFFMQRWLANGTVGSIEESLQLWQQTRESNLTTEWKNVVRMDPMARKVYGPSAAEKEQRRQIKRGERRQMLMRRFDQRAPPSERMFKQDTSFRSKGKPNDQEQQKWNLSWSAPAECIPRWMRGDSAHRQLIFPGDQRKI